ncbi:MAG: IS1182 family transposase [bacterium]|nr:IS1182 family transposase [bacterium]
MITKRNSTQSLFFDLECIAPDLLNNDSFYSRMHAYGDVFLKDEDYAPLYSPDTGRPGIPPSIIAGVLILQRNDEVSDYEAIEKLKYDLRWKYALNLPLDYEGFDRTVLVKFRSKLIAAGLERVSFDNLMKLAVEAKILSPENIQLADTSHILGAAAVQDTYQLIRSAILGALKQVDVKPANLEKYREGKADIDWEDRCQRAGHLKELVADAREVLNAAEDTEAKDHEAVKLLRDILSQDINDKDEIIKGTAKDRIISTNDTEMRHGRKSSSKRFDGHKAQIAEDLESELITNVDVIPGNAHDSTGSVELMTEQEDILGGRPRTLMGDGAYGTADNRADMEEAGIEIISKVRDDSSPDKYSKSDFKINLEQNEVTCPAGHITTKYSYGKDNKKRRVRIYKFKAGLCNECPHKDKCTKSGKGKAITLNYHEAKLQKARQDQQSDEFKALYPRRSTIERKVAEMMHRHGCRQARWIGRVKTKLQLLLAAAAVNFKRLGKIAPQVLVPAG